MRLGYAMMLVFLMLFVSRANAQYQLVWQHPVPQGQHIMEVRFLDEDRVIAFAGTNTQLTSENKGVEWTITNTSTLTIRSTSFVSETVGYGVGLKGRIFRTSDAGRTWQQLNSGETILLSGVHFMNELTGVVVGGLVETNLVLRTTDGGATWSKQVLGAGDRALKCVAFRDSLNGITAGLTGVMFVTSDGGVSWRSVWSGSSGYTISVITFASQSLVFALDYNSGYILRSTDAGGTWTSQLLGKRMMDVTFPSATHGFACGDDGWVFRTTDAGVTWAGQHISDQRLICIDFINPLCGVAAGFAGSLYRTTDGGETWTPGTTIVTTKNLLAVDYIDGMTGVAVGEAGGILRTTDAGGEWSTVTSGVAVPLRSIDLVEDGYGLAVGDDGTIIRTVNGGSEWATLDSKTSLNLNSVHCFSDLTATVVGESGMILQTTDGGDTWVAKNSTTTSSLSDVHFVDADVGCAVGADGVVLRTENGGDTWVQQQSGVVGQLLSVFFTDAENGTIGSKDGVILHTSDAGETWVPNATTTVASATSMSFASQTHGAMTGNTGIILTTDGGVTWSAMENTNGYDFRSVVFYDADNIVAVGPFGMVIRASKPTASSVREITDAVAETPILQHVPNPANEQTAIRFTVETGGDVALALYDASGRMVASLVNARMAPGSYEVQVNTAAFISGAYTYHLRTANGVSSRSMVIMH